MKMLNNLTISFAMATLMTLNANAQNNIQVTQSLIDEYEKYSQNNSSVFKPGSTIYENDFLPKNSKEFSFKIEVFKNDKQLLLSHMDIPNSTYTKIFNGNSLNKNKKEVEATKLNNGQVLVAETSVDESETNSLEIGLVVNKKKDTNILVSQIWIEQDNKKVSGDNKAIKPPKGKAISGEIALAPEVDKYIKEISIRHKENSKAVTFFEDYKIEISPI